MRIALQLNKEAKFFSIEKFEAFSLESQTFGYGYAFFKIIIYIYK